MIKHVVCYRLYERTEEKKQEVKEMFMSMKDKIEYIKEIQVEDMNAYQKHPYHLNTVKPFMAKSKELSVSVDYEF